MIKAFIVISKKQHFIVFCLQWFSNILVEGRQQKTKNKNIEARSPALQADSLLSEPPGKLKNMEVGSLSLLQGVFPTQESSQGLLHCRRILYQLSHQGSPSYITGLHFAIFMIFWKIVSFSCVPIIEPTWLFSRVFYLKTSFPSVYASECFINDLYITDN